MSLRLVLGLVVASVLFPDGSQVFGETYTYPQLVDEMTDLPHLSVLPPPGETTALASSYDRASRYDSATGKYVNWGANADVSGIVRQQGTESVLADIQGPGYHHSSSVRNDTAMIYTLLWLSVPREISFSCTLASNSSLPTIDLRDPVTPDRHPAWKSFGPFGANEVRFAKGWNLAKNNGNRGFVHVGLRQSCSVKPCAFPHEIFANETLYQLS